MEYIKKLAPPGISLYHEFVSWCVGLIFALLYSMRFLIAFGNERSSMYYYEGNTGVRYIVDDFVMPDFAELARGSMNGFFFVAVCVLVAIVYHYMYYSQGSHALYLVKRLPDRTYLAKTCLTLPILASVATLVLAFVVLLIYFGLYMLLMPEECLRAGQWARIWSFCYD